MTSYTCKRLCCAVTVVAHTHGLPMDLTLNGVAVTTRELAERHDLTVQAVRRRVDNGSCLTRARQKGNRARRIRGFGLNLCSDSDRLAARFNALPTSKRRPWSEFALARAALRRRGMPIDD